MKNANYQNSIINAKNLLSESVLCGIALIFIVYLLIFNMINIWPHNFHSDAAVSVIINNEARHEDSLIPRDWYYVNGDLFHYSLLAAPFVEKDNFSFNSHLRAEMLGLLILIGCSSYFSIVFFNKFAARFIFISVIFCGLSFQNARFIFFEQAYVLNLSFMFLASSSAYSLLVTNKFDGWRFLTKLIIFGFGVIFLVAINPIRSVTTVIPLLIAVCILMWLLKCKEKMIIIIIAAFFSYLVGVLIYFLFSFNKTIIYSAVSTDFIALNEFPSRFIFYLNLFLDYIGVYPLLGKNSLEIMGRILLAVFLIGGFMLFIKRAYSNNFRSGTKEKYIASTADFLDCLFVISFLVSFVLIISIKSLLINVSTIRYQIVPIIMLFACLISEYEILFENKYSLKYLRVVISLILVIVALNVYIPSNLNDYKKIPEKELIARSLESENIKVAYGTYWNASVVTVLSRSKVHVLPVGIIPIMSHWKMVSSDRLWRNRLLFDRSALIMTKAEYNYLSTISGNFIDSFPSYLKLIAINDNYYIAIYKNNIAKYIVESVQPKAIEKIKGEFVFHNCQSQNCVFNAVTGSILEISFNFFNHTEDVILSSNYEYPFNIGISLLDADGKVLEGDFARISFYRKVFPGEFIVLKNPIKITQKPGKYYLRFAIVREGMRWYLNEDGPVKLLEISIK